MDPGATSLLTGQYSTNNRQLGKGSFGKVYEATDLRNKQKVALKVINKQAFISKEKNPQNKYLKQRLLSGQVEIMKKLMDCDNENIVRCYDVLENNTYTIFVLECCDGGTLYGYIGTKGRLSEEETVFILSQIVYGFASLHKLNIIHRDIKTENILIKDGDLFKISDFGLSTAVNKLTGNERKTTLGTRYTMAPEVANDEYYSAQADIWSLGVIAFEMITGDFPFLNYITDQAIQDRMKVITGLQISPEFKQFFKSVFVIDPNKRLQWVELYRMYLNRTGIFINPSRPSSKSMRIQDRKLSEEDILEQRHSQSLFQPPLQKFNQNVNPNLLQLLRQANMTKYQYDAQMQKLSFNLKNAKTIQRNTINMLYDAKNNSFLQTQKSVSSYETQQKLLIVVLSQIIKILSESEKFINMNFVRNRERTSITFENVEPRIGELKQYQKYIYDLRSYFSNKISKIDDIEIIGKFFRYQCQPFEHIEKAKELKRSLLDIGVWKKCKRCYHTYICRSQELNLDKLEKMSTFMDNEYYDIVMASRPSMKQFKRFN